MTQKTSFSKEVHYATFDEQGMQKLSLGSRNQKSNKQSTQTLFYQGNDYDIVGSMSSHYNDGSVKFDKKRTARGRNTTSLNSSQTVSNNSRIVGNSHY